MPIRFPKRGRIRFCLTAFVSAKSDRHAERGSYAWLVYDPKDLAAVAAGTKKQWQIQPTHRWTDDVLPMIYDKKGWSGDGGNMVGGVTFDAKTKRLYVLASGVWSSGVERHPQIYVYQVGSPKK